MLLAHSNVYVLHCTLMQDMEGLGLIICTGIAIAQISIILASLVPLANINRAMHASRRHLPNIQVALDETRMALKLKYVTFFERITGRVKYGTSIGPNSVITSKIIFEARQLR